MRDTCDGQCSLLNPNWALLRISTVQLHLFVLVCGKWHSFSIISPYWAIAPDFVELYREVSIPHTTSTWNMYFLITFQKTHTSHLNTPTKNWNNPSILRRPIDPRSFASLSRSKLIDLQPIRADDKAVTPAAVQSWLITHQPRSSPALLSEWDTCTSACTREERVHPCMNLE